jgi:predicted GNAT superfamily acetyltransferase
MTREAEPVVRLRPIRAADLDALGTLNDAAVPAVNALGSAGLAEHVPRCDVGLVATGGTGGTGPTHLGFVLALAPGADYDSENYRWFSAHRPGSLYVDRVVVAPHAHRRGIGRALYDAVVRRAGELGLSAVTCEVNLEPANPESLAFHGRLGFTQVGEQLTKAGTVRVALMSRPL